MSFNIRNWKNLVLSALLVTGLVACGTSNSGQLSLSLTDAGTDQYKAVYVTIAEVSVHAAADAEGVWTVVSTPNRTFDLLALANGVREQLALAELDPGHYDQMRLLIGSTPEAGVTNILGQVHPFANYVIDTANAYHELKVPSGVQTGVKIVQGFDINDNSTTELILDFSASESVVVAGQSHSYLLKPTIRVLAETLASIISGTVTKAADQTAIPGALVGAQVYDGAATDEKDRVVVKTSTLTADSGAYKIFIAAGTYNLVATKAGFAPLPAAVTTTAGQTATQDFALTAAPDAGTIAGTVTIAGGSDETYVTLSFRQTITVNTVNFTVEVASVNVLNGQPYSVNLPVGTYRVVASSVGKTTQAADVQVTANTTTTYNVAF